MFSRRVCKLRSFNIINNHQGFADIPQGSVKEQIDGDAILLIQFGAMDDISVKSSACHSVKKRLTLNYYALGLMLKCPVRHEYDTFRIKKMPLYINIIK
jgi:hypothetical protein